MFISAPRVTATIGTATVRTASVREAAGRVVAAPPERVDEARVGVDVMSVEAQNLIDLGLVLLRGEIAVPVELGQRLDLLARGFGLLGLALGLRLGGAVAVLLLLGRGRLGRRQGLRGRIEDARAHDPGVLVVVLLAPLDELGDHFTYAGLRLGHDLAAAAPGAAAPRAARRPVVCYRAVSGVASISCEPLRHRRDVGE
jgi:hypothetical protein